MCSFFLDRGKGSFTSMGLDEANLVPPWPAAATTSSSKGVLSLNAIYLSRRCRQEWVSKLCLDTHPAFNALQE